MAFYGRRVTSGDTDFGIVGQNQQRTSVYNRMPENGWGHTLGFWGGRNLGGGTPTVKIGVWTTSNLTPATRMAYHNGITVSTYQSYGGDGQSYSVPVQNVNTALSPGSNAIKLQANANYAIGILPTGATVGHAMVQASKINGDNEQFYHRDGVTTPTNPNGYTYSSNEGWISAWIEYQPNRAPSASTSSPNGLITTTSPSFQGSFSDPDSSYGDHLNNLHIQVVRVSNNQVMWDSGSLAATSAERSSASFNRAYGGSALVAGVEYQWRVRVADDFGTWSGWTSYRKFTINGGGAVTTQGTPSGKQNSLQPTPFTARWTHASGLAMNAVQVRLRQGSAIIRTGNSVAKSVANNGNISTTWAEQFGSYSLNWGVGYSWEMRGRDTSNLWSDWTAVRTFSTNSPPSIPTGLTPTNSTPSTNRPILRLTASDPDGDAVTVKARIKNSAGTVLYTRTMTKGTGNTYTYQTTSTDLATHATYKWDAYTYDGHLYSGAVTSEGSATKSAEASFIYGEGPVVTITGPTESQVITTSTPTISWSVTDQQKKRVQVTDEESGVVVYDTGTITSTVMSQTIPSGVIRNGRTYSVVVTITNSAPLSGSSAPVTFSVQYPTPDVITGFHASPEYQRFDSQPSSIRLTWDQSTDTNFMEYLITRSDGLDEIILARITSPAQTVFTDYHPESGVQYVYGIVQATIQGLDVTVSPMATATSSVEIRHVVLVGTRNGAENRVALRFDEDRGFDYVDDLVLDQAWGETAPSGAYGTSQYRVFNGTFKLVSDEYGSAADHLNALRALWRSRETFSYRDERGQRVFAKITKFGQTDNRIQFYTVNLTLTEVSFREGVVE